MESRSQKKEADQSNQIISLSQGMDLGTQVICEEQSE